MSPALPGACQECPSLVTHESLLLQHSLQGLWQIHNHGILLAVRVAHLLQGGKVAIETRGPYTQAAEQGEWFVKEVFHFSKHLRNEYK